ncbi:MAG TPA: amidohydrolase family protein [bacterium]|nr:amidohydrolase family protein [bacterium]HOM26115.1 amidohydrolase family protein [bacterium]
MNIEFFDVNVWFGNLKDDIKKISVSLKRISEKLDELNIKKAIVYHISQRDVHPEFGNEILIKEIADKEKFYGIITLLPFQTDEIKKIDFKDLKNKKIVGFNFFPKKHNYILDKITFGDFLSELEYKNFPVFFDLLSGFSVDYRDVYSILNNFPKLTCILCNLGIWNTNRFTWPLIEKCPNVYLESSLLSLQEGGIEETVKKYGAERIVFGSGFPERYFEASILQLVHAEINEKDKEKIAHKNIERIIKRIKYE